MRFLNDRHNLLSQTVRYKIVADLCTKVLVDNYQGILDNNRVQEMLDTFIGNVTNILNIKVMTEQPQTVN